MPTAAVGDTPKNILEGVQQAARKLGSQADKDGQQEIKRLIQEYEQEAAKRAAPWASFTIEMGGLLLRVEAGVKTQTGGMTWLTRAQLVDFNLVNLVE